MKNECFFPSKYENILFNFMKYLSKQFLKKKWNWKGDARKEGKYKKEGHVPNSGETI